MKKPLVVILLAVAAYAGYLEYRPGPSQVPIARTATGDQVIARAFEQHLSNLQVRDSGRVVRVIPDDNKGSRHQHFIIRLASGQTLLIAHNIDLAPRLPGLRVGGIVAFSGEYEWNPKGGVVHWTHHDPSGRHPPGWLKYNGHTYQ